MEFGVLGPLQVNGNELALPSKLRVLLAALLLQANRVVPVDALIDAIWGDKPPSSARVTLQGYVRRLRQKIDGLAGRRIVTRDPGYLITVPPGELDLDSFTGLYDRARSAAASDDWNTASGLLRKALALWRGDPLADVHSDLLRRTELPRLAELRLLAVESRVEADLRLGRHQELIAELRKLASAEPVREKLHGQLMLALYRSGRQADALAAFRNIDRLLRDELGVSAGPELVQLHERMLAADPVLTAAQPEIGAPPIGAATAGTAVTPAQLPPDTADFTGRQEEVRTLCDQLAGQPGEDRPGVVVVSVIAGMGGIGKTALAVHLAHQLRERFPDGQLYVDLQGATSPIRPGEVLSRFLRDLGDPDTAIPADEAERLARYRTRMAARRMLIVLDDASSAAQVRPLLPGSAGCAVIVTSRSALTDLSGSVQLTLKGLGEDDARGLFAAIIGRPRADGEPAAAAKVVSYCAGLPLAVRIAARRLVSRPGWSIAHLAARLADARDRLTELATGDLAVRASFAVSYSALSARSSDDPCGLSAARLFRLLGLPDAAVLPLGAIAALAGRPPAEVRSMLEALADAHLVETPAPDRYRVHELLRSYAADLGKHADGAADRAASVARMLRWYAEQAVMATRMLGPAHAFPVIVPVAEVDPAMAGPAQALCWYEAELASLAIAVKQAARLGLHDTAAQIAMAMCEFFQRTLHVEDWIAISEAGVRSARDLDDEAALGFLLHSLADGYSVVSRFPDARRCLYEALAIRRQADDKPGEAMALNSLGITVLRAEQPKQALRYMRSALDVLAGTDDQLTACHVLNNTAHILRCLNRPREALDHLQHALAIQQDTGDEFGRSVLETTLGETYLDLERYDEAAEHCRRALSAQRCAIRDHPSRADALYGLGRALDALGRTGEAREAWQAALPILERLADPRAATLRERLRR